MKLSKNDLGFHQLAAQAANHPIDLNQASRDALAVRAAIDKGRKPQFRPYVHVLIDATLGLLSSKKARKFIDANGTHPTARATASEELHL